MIFKLNNKDAMVTYNKSSYGGSSPQDNSNCFPSALSTLTPASTDMVNNMEDMCVADTMISILNGDQNFANSIVTTRTAVVTTEASSSTFGGGRPFGRNQSSLNFNVNKNQALLPFVRRKVQKCEKRE